MATLYDYYNTGGNNHSIFVQNRQVAQTFTASENYTISSLKLKIYRDALWTPVPTIDLKVEIQGTDENGHPDGNVLASATIAYANIPVTTADWEEIAISCDLTNGEKYAIVLYHTPDNDISVNYHCYWRVDSTSPIYTGGNYEYSNNDGGTWASTGSDFMFEVWGQLTFRPPNDVVTLRRLVAAANNKIWYEDIS